VEFLSLIDTITVVGRPGLDGHGAESDEEKLWRNRYIRSTKLVENWQAKCVRPGLALHFTSGDARLVDHAYWTRAIDGLMIVDCPGHHVGMLTATARARLVPTLRRALLVADRADFDPDERRSFILLRSAAPGVEAGTAYGFKSGDPDFALLDSRWHGAEDWGTWARGQEAALLWSDPQQSLADGRIRLDLYLAQTVAGAQTLDFLISGRNALSLTVRSTPIQMSVELPLGSSGPGDRSLVIRAAFADSPRIAGYGDDNRDLSFGLIAASFSGA
jgi:hypothetical protein